MRTYKPHDLVYLSVPEVSTRPRVVELISYPFPSDSKFGINSKEELIQARMVPGDPTTMVTIKISDIINNSALKSPLPKSYRYVHIAEVSGMGSFPEDMLRYDNAALCDHTQPEEPLDEMMRSTFRPDSPVLICRVTEAHRKKNAWTTTRWSSFLWTVKPIKTFDLRKQPFTEAKP